MDPLLRIRDFLALVALALALLCTSPAVVEYAHIARFGRPPAETPSALEERLAPLRPELEPGETLGLLALPPRRQTLFAAQYALAPAQVVPGQPIPDLELPPTAVPFRRLVAVFPDDRALTAAARRRGLERVATSERPGPGVALLAPTASRSR